jgi:hypothetical protein
MVGLAIPAATLAVFLAFALPDSAPTGAFGQGLLILGWITFAAAALVLGACWWTTLRILWRTTGSGRGRLIMTGAGIPIGWAFCATIGLGIWPCLAGLAWIAIDGFRK